MNSFSIRILGFSSILFLCSIFYTGLVLDFTLSPRFFLASSFLSVFVLIGTPKKWHLGSISKCGYAFIGLAIWSFLSWFWATNPNETWFSSVRWACASTVFFIASYLFKQRKNSLSIISYTAAILGVLSSLFLLLQYFEIDIFNIQGKAATYLYYITGFNSHKNLASSFLFILIPFLFVHKNDTTIKETLTKGHSSYLRLSALVVIVATILLLKTRTVWIALAITGITYGAIQLLLHKNKITPILKKVILFGLPIGIIALVTVVFLYIHSKSSTVSNTDSFWERIQIWRNTILIIKDNPILGVGAGNWHIHFPEYSLENIWRSDKLNISFQRPHNDFLWVFSELGIIGFILLLATFCGVIYSTIKHIIYNSPPNEIPLNIIIFIAFAIGGSVILFLDFPTERAEHLLWMSVGLAFLDTRNVKTEKSNAKWQLNIWTSLLAKAIVCVILLGCSYISFLHIKGEFYTKQMQANSDAESKLTHAMKAYSFAYTVDPVSSPMLWYAGNIHIAKGNYSQAMGYFKQAYKEHPFNRYVLNDLATCYMLLGNYSLAEKYYIEANRISPRFDNPLLNLVGLLIQLGRFEEANQWNFKIKNDSERRSQLEEILRNEGYEKIW